jgi:carbonic anhydrase
MKRSIIISMIFPFLLVSCGIKNSKTHEQEVNVLHEKATYAGGHSAEKLKPAEVLAELKEGNRSFVKQLSPSNSFDHSAYNYFEQIAHSKNEQHPIACVLTCMDSRVPPEIIFDLGIGSLFVIRVAGNIDDHDVLGSMEYAVAEKKVGVIVVMGHKNCGAIAAAFGTVDPVNKDLALLVAHVKKDVIENDVPPYDASAKHNVKKTIENIVNGSKTIRDKLVSGDLVIAGALYDVSNGTINWDSNGW